LTDAATSTARMPEAARVGRVGLPRGPLPVDADEQAEQNHRMKHWGVLAGTATAAAALIGAAATRPKTAWYRSLEKPAWQPPPQAFPLVWTPLYVSIGWAAARALRAAPSARQRGAYAAVLGADLALNAGWCWAFFAGKSVPAGLSTIAALNVANLALVTRSYRVDRTAAAALLPYVVWTGFATVLNVSLWRRN
jgi:translocator protein